SIDVETDPGSSLAHTSDVAGEINDRLDAYHEFIETNYVNIGGDDMMGGGSADSASYTIQLTPSTDRDKSTEEIVREMDDDLQEIPGADIQVNAMDTGMNMGDPIEIKLSGPEHEVLDELADQVVTEIESVDGIFNPDSAQEAGRPQMIIQVDKEKAAQYGLTEEQIKGQIELKFTGQVASVYREKGHEMNVTLVYPEDERRTINDLNDMKIQSAEGASIPLEEV